MEDYYETIFKRKSSHLFRGVGDDKITVCRYKKPGKRGIMPANAVSYYNRIDMGIYLCILEICMHKKGIGFTRELYADNGGDQELTKVAEYSVKEE